MKKLVIANWKMHPNTAREAARLASTVERGVLGAKKVGLVIAPPFPFLQTVYQKSKLKLGAQNVFFEPSGAYTGEVSATQLHSLGVSYVIVGHSERRALGETNDMVRKKLKAALSAGMHTVLCVGENERKRDTAFPEIIRAELHEGLQGISKKLLRRLIIAYEPVWAIGTGRTPTPNDVFEMTILIRRELYRMAGKRKAREIPILYGGSIDEKNVASFVREGRVDGLLVGGASLRAKKFIGIVQAIAAL